MKLDKIMRMIMHNMNMNMNINMRLLILLTILSTLSTSRALAAVLSEYALSNDVDSYPIRFSGFDMMIEVETATATEDRELNTRTINTIRALSEREIDSNMLLEYGMGMNYSSASYSYMDDLVFKDINYNDNNDNGSDKGSDNGSGVSVIGISVSEGYTYFNVPYGANKPKEEGIDVIIENAVNCEELVQLMGQTGIDELSQVRSIKYISNSNSDSDGVIDDMDMPAVPVPIEKAPDSSKEQIGPIAKPNYIPVIISMAVLTSLLSFFALLFVYRRKGRKGKENKHKTKSPATSPPSTPSTIQVLQGGPDTSFHTDFILSKSTSDVDIESPMKPTKAFPIMLRKDMLSPTQTTDNTNPKIPFMERPRRKEEEGNTVLASSHFVAPPPTPSDAISTVSSIDFDMDGSTVLWDPNDTMIDDYDDTDTSRHGHGYDHDNPFVDPIPSSKSRLLENDVKISRCRDDSVVL